MRSDPPHEPHTCGRVPVLLAGVIHMASLGRGAVVHDMTCSALCGRGSTVRFDKDCVNCLGGQKYFIEN